MIKILFFIDGIAGGGAEKVLCNLVNHMDQSKFNITVQTFDEYDSKKYLVNGIHYKVINRCKSRFGKRIFSYLFRIFAELKLAYQFFIKDNYDIEVAYLEAMPTKIIAQSMNKKAKKIAWVHCDLSKKEGMKGSKKKVKKQYRKFDKIVCVSEDVKRGFYQLYGNDFDIRVLYNVIDENEIYQKSKQKVCNWEIDPEQIQLLAVGRLSLQKDFSYLIRTCAMLKNSGCKFHLNILGDGPEKERLQKQIDDLGLHNEITLRGFMRNPYPWMKLSDIIVCSSKYEGISTVIQEALILGKPIVTTPCTGMKELLGDSDYGMIVNSSEEGLYEGLFQMCKSENMRSYYSEKAKERGFLLKKSSIIRSTQDFFVNIL